MESLKLKVTYLELTTPHVADAAMRLGIPIRVAPASVKSNWPNTHFVGRARPVRHYGSVDVFLEAINNSDRGDVLVVDNSGRLDEACVGDLVTLEASLAGISGAVIWGLHRDTPELKTIRLPLFSLGTLPVGPQRLDRRQDEFLTSASFGDFLVTGDDFVLADDDGIIFIPLDKAAEVAEVALSIRETERYQASKMLLGQSFRSQASFDAYLNARETDPELSFRQHLRAFGAEIEE
ncbi:putative regulator of ribonuclease activity [compost metagenome]